MKKLIIGLVAFLAIFGGGGAIFRNDISSWISGKKDQVLDMALKNLSEKYPIPENVQADIKNITKKADPAIILEFLKDPNALVNSKAEGAMSFVNSPDGKRLMEYYNKYMKNPASK